MMRQTQKAGFLDEHELHEWHELIDKRRIHLFERTRIARIARMIKEPGLENEHELHE